MKSDRYSLQRAQGRDQNHDKVVMVHSEPLSKTNPEYTGTASANIPVNHGINSPNGYENPAYGDEPGWRYIVDLDALEVLQVHNQQISQNPRNLETDPRSSQSAGPNSAVLRTAKQTITGGHGSVNKDVHSFSASPGISHEYALTKQESRPHHTVSKPKHTHKEYKHYQSQPSDHVFTFSSDHVQAYEQEIRSKRDTNHYEPIENSANRYRYEIKETTLKPKKDNIETAPSVQQNEFNVTNNGAGKSRSHTQNQNSRGQRRPRQGRLKDTIHNNDSEYADITRQPSPCFRYRMHGNHDYDRYDIISNHKVAYNQGVDNHGFQSADVSVVSRVSDYMVVPAKQEPAVIYSRKFDQDNHVSPVQETARVLLEDNMDETSQGYDRVNVAGSCPRDTMDVPGSCQTNVHCGESDTPHEARPQKCRVYPRAIDDEQHTGSNAMPQVHSQNRRPATTNSLRNTGRVMIDVSQNTFKKIARQLSNPAGESKNYDVALPIRVRKPNNHSDLALFSCICCLSPFGVVALVMAALTDIRYREGDMSRARKYSRLALIFGIVGIVSTVLVAITVLAASAGVYYSRDH